MSEIMLPDREPSTPSQARWLTGSLFYLVSAACILIGLTKILVPIFDADGHLDEKLLSVGMINLYEIGLLGVLLVVMWRRVYDDAISLAMLVAVFLVASAVTLNVVAANMPMIVMGLGVIGLGLCVGKLALIAQRVTGRFRVMCVVVMMILMTGNLAMPGIMGYVQANEGTNSQLHELWMMGWWWTMVGVLLLTGATLANMVEPFCGEVSRPIVRSSLFRMGFVMLIVIASLGQSWAMQWAFFLKGGLPDLLLAWPVLTVCVLAWIGLPNRELDYRHIVGMLLPGAIVVSIKLIWEVDTPLRSPWFLVTQPSAVLIITCVLVLVWARRSPWWLLISITGVYGLLTVIFWPGRQGSLLLSPIQISWVVTGVSIAIAVGVRHYAASLLASVCSGVSLLTLPGILQLWDHGSTHGWLCLILVPAVLCTVTLCFYRRVVPLRLTVALLALGQMIVMILLNDVDTLTAMTLWVIFAMFWSGSLVWVHRQWLLILPGVVPMLMAGYILTDNSPGWQMVGVSFLLLLAGMGVSWHRSQTQVQHV